MQEETAQNLPLEGLLFSDCHHCVLHFRPARVVLKECMGRMAGHGRPLLRIYMGDFKEDFATAFYDTKGVEVVEFDGSSYGQDGT